MKRPEQYYHKFKYDTNDSSPHCFGTADHISDEAGNSIRINTKARRIKELCFNLGYTNTIPVEMFAEKPFHVLIFCFIVTLTPEFFNT